MKRFLPVLTVLFLSLPCCTRTGTKGIDVDYSHVADTLDLSPYVESITKVPLDTGAHPLGYCQSAILKGDTIAAVDPFRKEINAFLVSGEFVGKIARKGRGPGEYTTMTCTFYDNHRGKVAIYDENTGRLNFYSFKGDFSGCIEDFGGTLVKNVIDIPEGYLCSAVFKKEIDDPAPSGVWTTDKNGNFTKSLIEYDKDLVKCEYSPVFFRIKDGSTEFMEQYSSDIYSYKNGKLKKVVDFNLTDWEKLPDGSTKDYTYGMGSALKSSFKIINFAIPGTRTCYRAVLNPKTKEMIFSETFKLPPVQKGWITLLPCDTDGTLVTRDRDGTLSILKTRDL